MAVESKQAVFKEASRRLPEYEKMTEENPALEPRGYPVSRCLYDVCHDLAQQPELDDVPGYSAELEDEFKRWLRSWS